ncbi:MAG: TraB/GumN family protein, partial [Thermodesulfobacteriota bacterium]
MANEENATEGVTRLEAGGRQIILVGTAHVSRQSAELAESVIEEEKPDTVCVELCASRHQSIRNSEQWRNMNIVKVVREKKAFVLLANMMLTSFQKRIGEKLGVRPGEEMIRALDAAEAAGSQICLADRDITVTLSRTWRSTGLWNKIKLFFQMILSMGDVGDIDEQAIEEMKKEDILQSLLSELEKSHPSIRKILIDERDRYMAHSIQNTPGQKIVAVVGAGHVPGIKKYLYEEIDTAPLETVPPRGRGVAVFKWLLPAVILFLIAYGFYYGGADAGRSMVFWWIALNAVFAGLGATAALAHPVTILSAVAAAPLTSLNPMIAAGWVAGLVEAWVKKPKVGDLEDLPADIMTVKGFWRNKV